MLLYSLLFRPSTPTSELLMPNNEGSLKPQLGDSSGTRANSFPFFEQCLYEAFIESHRSELKS